MLDFVEKAYFFEIERKTKLQTALAFPISMVVIGTALFGRALETWLRTSVVVEIIGLLLLISAGIALVVFLFCVGSFLIGRTYRYVWTADQALSHLRELEEFSKRYPTAPAARETFEAQLTSDLANCAETNARLNDARSSNLYYANIAAFVYILAGLVGAAIPVLSQQLM